MSSSRHGGESGDRLKADVLDAAAREFESGALLSPQLRAALRGDLTPSAEDTERVRGRLWSAVSVGALPPAVHRVDLAMASHGAGVKAGVAAVGHTLATKLVVSSLMLAGAVGVVAVATPGKPTPSHTQASHVSVGATRSVARSAPAKSLADPPPEPTVASASAVPDVVALAQPTIPSEASPAPREMDVASARSSGPAQHPLRASRPVPRRQQLPLTAAAVQPQEPKDVIAEPPAAQLVASKPASPTLNAELALVHAASAALDAHDPERVLAIVSRYMTQYPQGDLRVEVDAMRVMALCLAHRAGAGAQRDGFLREHPASALAARVLRACAQQH